MQDGDRIILSSLPTRNLNIRVDVSGSVVSVDPAIERNGSPLRNVVQNVAPYSVFGDQNSTPIDYRAWSAITGWYQLQSVPYSQRSKGGTMGQGQMIFFEIVERDEKPKKSASLTMLNQEGGSVEVEPRREVYELQEEVWVLALPKSGFVFTGWYEAGQLISLEQEYALFMHDDRKIEARFIPEKQFTEEIRVAEWWLIDIDTEELIRPIEEGDLIDPFEYRGTRLGLQALLEPKEVGSVTFSLFTNELQQVAEMQDHKYPYTLIPETEILFPGNYLAQAIPFTEPKGQGQQGVTSVISFTVAEYPLSNKEARFYPTKNSKSAPTDSAFSSDITIEAADFTIYPVPATQQNVHLQYRSPTAEPVQLVIYSLAGVPVHQSKSNGWLDETIESNTLRPGVYIAVLTTATQRLSRRLVVQ